MASLFGLPSRAIDIMLLTSSDDAIALGLYAYDFDFILISQTNSNLLLERRHHLKWEAFHSHESFASAAAEIPGPAPRHSATIEHLSGISGWLYSRMYGKFMHDV